MRSSLMHSQTILVTEVTDRPLRRLQLLRPALSTSAHFSGARALITHSELKMSARNT